MAAAQPKQDINETVRTGLRKGLFAATILVPAAVLLYLLYLAVFEATPRQKLKTPDATLAAYSGLVAPYLGLSGAMPPDNEVREFLSYFDADSRRFFDDNASRIAQRRFQFDKPAFEALSDGQKRAYAMVELANRPPLSGMGRIHTQRRIGDDRVELQVDAKGGKRAAVFLEKDGNLWYIMKLGGLRDTLEKELESLDQKGKAERRVR